MIYDQKNKDLDAKMIVLGFAYATFVLVLVGWIATLVL